MTNEITKFQYITTLPISSKLNDFSLKVDCHENKLIFDPSISISEFNQRPLAKPPDSLLIQHAFNKKNKSTQYQISTKSFLGSNDRILKSNDMISSSNSTLPFNL